MSIAGLILAGGASRRMGTAKALLTLRGETFLDRLIRVIGECCDPVVVVLGHGRGREHGASEHGERKMRRQLSTCALENAGLLNGGFHV